MLRPSIRDFRMSEKRRSTGIATPCSSRSIAMSWRSSSRSGCSLLGRTTTWPASLMSKKPAPQPSTLYSVRAASIDQREPPFPAPSSIGVVADSAMCVAMVAKTSACGSGKENLHRPSVAGYPIQLAPVEPTRHAFPELDALRSEAKPGPVWRTRNDLFLEPLLELGDAGFQLPFTRDDAALLRRPCADLAAARPRAEVRVGFRCLDGNSLSLDANLHLERLPVEAHRR